ncbi:cation transporter, partial [Streptococcus pyogenes]
LKEPISVLSQSFKEFARSTVQNDEIHDKINDIFRDILHTQADKLDILIFKQGMHIKVKIYILKPEDSQLIESLVLQKNYLLDKLTQEFDHCSLEFSF